MNADVVLVGNHERKGEENGHNHVQGGQVLLLLGLLMNILIKFFVSQDKLELAPFILCNQRHARQIVGELEASIAHGGGGASPATLLLLRLVPENANCGFPGGSPELITLFQRPPTLPLF